MSRRIIIIGGGPNGLAAAGVLAKAGRDVLLLEAREVLGGMAAREVFREGYAAPGLHHDTAVLRPHVVDALRLEDFGLAFHERPARVRAVRSGGGGIDIVGDRLEGDVSDRVHEQYAAFRAFIAKVRPVIARVMDAPPLSPSMSLWSALKTGWALRRLGPATMMELLRTAPMAVADWMRDSFDDDRFGASLALAGLVGASTGPWSAHTAATLLVRECLASRPVVGGPAAITDALAKAAESHGAVLRRGARVARVDTRNGKVAGVTLEGGDSLPAEVVLSTLDPRRTFLELVARGQLPLALTDAAARYRMRGTTAKVHLALSGPLEDAAGEAVEALTTGDDLNAVERAYDAAKYRRFATEPALDVTVPSVADPSLCPPGHAVVSILAHAAAHDLEGGWTPAQRDALGDAVIATLARSCPTVRDRIVDAEVLTPADIEARYGVSGGHILHGEHAPDQLLFMRPSVYAGSYATPLPGLFIGGGASHPGGGLTCGPGALAARAVIGDG